MAKPTDIELTVGLSAADVKKSAKDLGDSIKDVFERSAGSALDTKMQKLQTQMSQSASKADNLVRKLEELENVEVPTKEYSEVSKRLDKMNSQFDKLLIRQDEMMEAGQTSGPAWDKLNVQMDRLGTLIREDEAELQQLVDTGRAFTLGSDTDEYRKLSNELGNVNNQSRILINTWDNSEEVMKGTLDKSDKSTMKLNKSLKETVSNMHKVNDASKSFGKGISGLSSGIKKFLRAAIGISSLLVLFNKLKSAAMEGIKSMVQWEGQNGRLNKSISSIQSSIATLKNNIGAMVAPLINALAPAITKIIDLISTAIQKISMFFALLGGKSTITVANKVQSNYAASLDKTASSAKKAEKALKGYLSPLDEINKFQSDKDTDTGGGGGGAAGPTFSEIPIDQNMFKWLDKLQSLINYLKKLWGKFKQGFFEGLGDWETRVARLKQGLNDIATALSDIWNDPAVQGAADQYLQSLAHMLGALAGSVASIGLTIATNLVAGLGNYLRDNTDRIKQYLIDMFDIGTEINDELATLFTDIAYIFEAWASENGIRITAAIIGIFSDAFMGVTELVAKFGRDLLNLIVQPLDENKEHIRKSLEDTFGFLADILETVKADVDYVFDSINQAYDEHLKPLFDDLSAGISEILDALLSAYDQYFKPVWDNITQSVSEFSATYFRPMIDSIMSALGPLIDLIKMLWHSVLQPLLVWVADRFVEGIATKIQFLWTIIQYCFKVITMGVTTTMNVLGTILKFVRDVFTVGWQKAFENLATNLAGIWETFKSQVKGVINAMIDIVNSFIDMIGSGLNTFLSGLQKVADFAAPLLDMEPGTIGRISMPHIPHLAQGAVIPPNKEFMAVLGDQKSGTNIETPLSTMVEAFTMALQQNGGAGGVQQINFLLPDRRTLAQYTIQGGKIIQTSTGKNPFELA